MWHHIYSVRYSVVPISSSLLTITFYSLVISTLVHNGTKYSVITTLLKERKSHTMVFKSVFLQYGDNYMYRYTSWTPVLSKILILQISEASSFVLEWVEPKTTAGVSPLCDKSSENIVYCSTYIYCRTYCCHYVPSHHKMMLKSWW